jgi:hypothetical protein
VNDKTQGKKRFYNPYHRIGYHKMGSQIIQIPGIIENQKQINSQMNQDEKQQEYPRNAHQKLPAN